jgi:hypothetical protein
LLYEGNKQQNFDWKISRDHFSDLWEDGRTYCIFNKGFASQNVKWTELAQGVYNIVISMLIRNNQTTAFSSNHKK